MASPKKKSGSKVDEQKPIDKSADFTAVSIPALGLLTGKDHRTVRKRLEQLPPSRVISGKTFYDPVAALPLIYELHYEGEILDSNQENAKLVRLKAVRQQLENDRATGKLIPIEFIEKQWADLVVAFRAKLLSMPSKLAPRLAALSDPRKIEDEIIRERDEALTQLSNYEPNIEAMAGDQFSSEESSETGSTASDTDD